VAEPTVGASLHLLVWSFGYTLTIRGAHMAIRGTACAQPDAASAAPLLIVTGVTYLSPQGGWRTQAVGSTLDFEVASVGGRARWSRRAGG
jgi:hypothetical protein